MKNSEMPVISIIGRPNVGKSSLFNRFVGRRHAVIEEREGTTRDRNEQHITAGDKRFVLVDTGGFLPDDKDGMQVLVKSQIERAITTSDALIFVCDGEQGLLPLDEELAGLLRTSGKRIFLVVNKLDNEKREEGIFEFYQLGLGEPFGISCIHNRGVQSLLKEVSASLPLSSEAAFDKRHPIRIAIVGRPNVGKSSFLNRVLDEERVIVHDKPGTTRDAIDSYFQKDGVLYLLIDTAGIRHMRKVKEAVDVYSMMRARESIDRSDVALLLIDGNEGITKDDSKIFDYIKDRGKGCVIVVNKWDLVKRIEVAKYAHAIQRRMPESRNFHVAFISAKTGRNVLKAFNLVTAIKTDLDLFIDADTLTEFLEEIAPGRVSVSRRRRIPRFFFMTQTRVFPREFCVFVNNPHHVTDFHTAYIENRLRERFPLRSVPLKIMYERKPRAKRNV